MSGHSVPLPSGLRLRAFRFPGRVLQSRSFRLIITVSPVLSVGAKREQVFLPASGLFLPRSCASLASESEAPLHLRERDHGKSTEFQKIDITRAIEGARAGGLPVGRIEIEGGKIIIVAASEAAASENDLDRWMRDNAR